ncbi:MAG: hypothetical protein WC895_04385 [Candidatus Shapirobacteria bacterium]|jgi:hypothetical protein
MADVTLPPRFEYTEQVEKLIKLLEDQGAEVGWSDLGEVVIDYLEDELSHGMLVHRYKCTPGRATRILSILNNATGRNYVPITSKLSKVASALLAHGEIALASEVLALLKKAGEVHYQVSVYPGSVDDENTSLDYSELADAASRAAQKDFADTMGPAGLAEYIAQDEELYGKVTSIYDPVIRIDSAGKVTTTFQVNTSTELSPEEEEALKGYILGQCSDGWGEAFEQWPIKVSDGEIPNGDIRLSPWTSGAEATVEKKGMTTGVVRTSSGYGKSWTIRCDVKGTKHQDYWDKSSQMQLKEARMAIQQALRRGRKVFVDIHNRTAVVTAFDEERFPSFSTELFMIIAGSEKEAREWEGEEYFQKRNFVSITSIQQFDQLAQEKISEPAPTTASARRGSMEAVHEYAKVAFPHIKAATEAMLDLGDWGADFGDEGGAYEALLDKFDAVYEGFKKLSEGQKLA